MEDSLRISIAASVGIVAVFLNVRTIHELVSYEQRHMFDFAPWNCAVVGSPSVFPLARGHTTLYAAGVGFTSLHDDQVTP
jgi:hypothetical protein